MTRPSPSPPRSRHLAHSRCGEPDRKEAAGLGWEGFTCWTRAARGVLSRSRAMKNSHIQPQQDDLLRPPQPLRKTKHRRHTSSRRRDVSDNSTGRWDRKSRSQTWRPRCQNPLPTLKLSRLDLHDNTDALRKT